MAQKIYLTSFYGVASVQDPHWPDRQARLHQSALAHGGVDEIMPWNAEKLLATSFAERNAATLALPRGYGYWLWKPFIILQALESIAPGDFVVYHDVGRSQRGDPKRGYTLERDIAPLIRWAEANGGIYPGVFMPHHGKQKHWTKRDCFVLMGCDGPEYWDTPQVQATYNIWHNTPEVNQFVRKWLTYCEDPRILTDSDNTCGKANAKGFKEHRHDQSILTNLCIKHQLNIYGSADQSVLLHRNLNSLIRHARLDELKEKNQLVLRSSLAGVDRQQFDRSLIRWIELYYAERRQQPLSILLVGTHRMELWQQYAPNANIRRITDEQILTDDQGQYDLVVINESQPETQFALVTALFPKLNPGGLLACGKVQKQWDTLPPEHQSALSLVRDFWHNKEITHDQVAAEHKQQINQKLLMTFSAWDHSGECGNAFFIRHDS